MARDVKDKSTLPLIPEARRPGRPSTGSALTAAQRKAAQRARDREKVGNENLSDASITALCERLQRTVSMGDVDLVKGITMELLRRAKSAFKENVTVTKTKTPSGGKSNPVTVTKTKAPVPKSKSVTVTKTKSSPGVKSGAVTVTKTDKVDKDWYGDPVAQRKLISTSESMRKREAEIKKMISQAKSKQPSLL